MTKLILVAVCGIFPKGIRVTLTKLCYFNAINLNVIDPEALDDFQTEAIVTLCQLDMYFPPPFFGVILHLIVHIVGKTKACGLVFM